MDISDSWGYAGVILPRKMSWQGFVVIDPSHVSMIAPVEKAIKTACSVLSFQPEDPRLAVEGALMATLVEFYEQGRVDGVAVLCSAISQYMGERFWVVDAYVEDGGTKTNFVSFKVATPDAARDAINSRILPLKMGQVIQSMR